MRRLACLGVLAVLLHAACSDTGGSPAGDEGGEGGYFPWEVRATGGTGGTGGGTVGVGVIGGAASRTPVTANMDSPGETAPK